ncbi:LytR/AlgR family response regulator transcription factor [Roseateles saccharophilus]|uniref:LytTR family two component transcriptional regulator n=1 Tax=Roseateles saccharophilus TaxID=304 RepID=A0A4V2VS47_ROSSA|nr:LytTR family DNA-binding domain-containing protein [Roseateles saccharophilus]MDG0831570.1 response regulator transcription factor [Roseateles saccharophilus]TCV01020.1 LytTR family two component transcriptional regulator [Roseateles saccharophilus]
MTTALLADDEPQLLDELRELLAEAWPELDIVALARNGTEARRLLDKLRPDIAFLDIRMPGIDGLALAQLVPAGTRLVFVTAHAEHALAAFERAAVDYLHKPVTPARLAATVQRLQAAQLPRAGLRFLQAWTGNTMKLLDVDQLAALRSEQRHTRALSQGGEQLLLRTSLGELQQALDPQLFWQIHRGSVVNARAIERIERRDDGDLWVHMRGLAQALLVSRAHRGRFKGM